MVLRISLLVTLAYIAVTLIAGLRSHSLALLSEAGHNASDFLALALSFFALYMEGRPPTPRKTFGYQRAGVLAAFLNALTLVVISVWIAYEAIHRLAHPVAVEPNLMIAVAIAGVLMNGVIAGMLWGVARDVNMRSAFLHMAGDTLSTAAVILGGILIHFTGALWIDPALSLVIAALILWSSFSILRETLDILLEGTPRGLNLDEIRTAMATVPCVLSVHDLHVWSLGSNAHALASHVQIPDIPPSESAQILDSINDLLHHRFHINHTTIQFEHADADCCAEYYGCVVPVEALSTGGAHHHHH